MQTNVPVRFSQSRMTACIDSFIGSVTAEILVELERRVRVILRRNGRAKSFCMAMGGATFYDKKREPIMDSLKAHGPVDSLIEEYDDLLHLTGIPMMINGPDEPIITDW